MSVCFERARVCTTIIRQRIVNRVVKRHDASLPPGRFEVSSPKDVAGFIYVTLEGFSLLSLKRRSDHFSQRLRGSKQPGTTLIVFSTAGHFSQISKCT